jgi:hypothetical protein
VSTQPLNLLPLPGTEGTAFHDTPQKEIKTEMRVLTPEETQKLAPIFERAGAVLPDPSSSFIIGILENGVPTNSFLTIQAALHGEPMNVEPRHRMYIRSMVHFAENEVLSRCGVQNVFIFAPEGDVKKMAEAFGWVEEPWRVLSKRVGPAGEPN